MSFFKKLTQVATDAASAVQEKTKELQKVYKDESWSGILDRAEKNLDNLTTATGDYLENLKNVNEKVIDETAKNANSSWEAIWKSTVAVSLKTVNIVASDIKNQAVRLFKAWEDIEVRKVLSKEKAFLYEATEVLSPAELLVYCGAKPDGAFFAFDNNVKPLTIEVYGQIWIDPKTQQHHNGSMNLLQYIVVNSTTENLSEDMLLNYCLNIMFKIPEVRNRYDALYAEYLASNPEVEPLETPFAERNSAPKEETVEPQPHVEENIEVVQDAPKDTPKVVAAISPEKPNLWVGVEEKIGVSMQYAVDALNSTKLSDEELPEAIEKFKKAQPVLFTEYNEMSKKLQAMSKEREKFYSDNALAIDFVAENAFTSTGMSEINKAMQLYSTLSMALTTLVSRAEALKVKPAPRKVATKKVAEPSKQIKTETGTTTAAVKTVRKKATKPDASKE